MSGKYKHNIMLRFGVLHYIHYYNLIMSVRKIKYVQIDQLTLLQLMVTVVILFWFMCPTIDTR